MEILNLRRGKIMKKQKHSTKNQVTECRERERVDRTAEQKNESQQKGVVDISYPLE